MSEIDRYAIFGFQHKRYAEPGTLLPLIDDIRTNYDLQVDHTDGVVRLKYPAFSTKIHQALIIPDRRDLKDITDVTLSPDGLLKQTLNMAADVANYYLENPDMAFVETFFHYSGREKKKGVATQPNFHIHTIGTTHEDLDTHRMDVLDAREQDDLRPALRDPLQGVIAEIIDSQVLPTITQANPSFEEVLQRIPEPATHLKSQPLRKVTFTFAEGSAGITDPALPGIIKDIHEASLDAYNKIGKVFFKWDEKTGSFAYDENDPTKRNILLTPEERKKRLEEYLKENPLSPLSTRYLKYFAENAQPMQSIYDQAAKKKGSPLTEEQKNNLFTRYAPINNLAYSFGFSGRKVDGDTRWTVAFTPMVLSKQGYDQSSPITTQLTRADRTAVHSNEMKQKINEQHTALVAQLLTLPNRNYQTQPPKV